MEQILGFIQNNGTKAIVILGIVVLALLIWNGIVLSDKRSRIEEALVHKDNRYFKDTIKKELYEEEDGNSSATPDKIRALETDFNAACSVHDVLVQLIPIFPLLGILGTVAGLMLQAGENDTSALMGAIDTALDTTFWGLVSAIVLKFVEAVFPSRIINAVEVMLDDFYKKIDLADIFKSIDSREKNV